MSKHNEEKLSFSYASINTFFLLTKPRALYARLRDGLRNVGFASRSVRMAVVIPVRAEDRRATSIG